MRAALYQAFRAPLAITRVSDPEPPADGVVIRVAAAGLCRSDWHGWQGHDPDIRPPHVPGHEFAGTVTATGAAVTGWRAGDRVTAPFCLGCGTCAQCRAGQQQICDRYYQPGFTGWGAFAEYVALPHADANLVALGPETSFVAAATLGCRFATAFRAVVIQGRARPGEWVAVHGCGGVGLSAVMIAHAIGARAVAVDIRAAPLALARELGAAALVQAGEGDDVAGRIRDITGGGAHVSLDALGSTATCLSSIACLRKQGRHVQVGLMTGADARPAIPLSPVIAQELEILGSHGLQAHRYPAMLALIASGQLRPERLVTKRIALDDVVTELPRMGDFPAAGVTVIERF